ncbi:DUF6090 family protein [Winogradskyella ouciana]|uniref:Uncharacterized protein n=1 Tax=Winogradskyella ouciana TaxID=2608631 RepID=A0A7K1GEZ0_9FLAO|nr:DUF6090 family protein [Winogradskyella ouciana]MTE27867.1 hypothetical protein [Winogradskyella ouciana]
MIKFFRHIRQSMIKQNKTKKYLLYAIGEIILVVIGILIALQINNWNNDRINANREASYVINIERDLNNQIKAIDLQIDFEKEITTSCRIALKPYNETNTFKIDSITARALGTITSRRTFLNTNPTYTELISSGNIELLKNENFKDQLINYYQELERIEKVIDKNNTYFTDQQFIPVIYRLGTMDSSKEWDNIFRGFMRQYKSENPLTTKNLKRLTDISNTLLKQDENELIFANYLSEREGIAILHIFFLLEFKAQTKQLLKAIKVY